MLGHFLAVWERLKTFSEGNGTMADSTLMVMTNMNGGPHHQGGGERYFVMLGSAGGAFKTGKYLSFAKGSRPFTGDLFTSIVNAMGVPDAKFGDPTATKGPLAGLS
jgi:hypothetical protein